MTDKKKKNYQTVSFEALERAQQSLGMGDVEFGAAIGYAATAMANWRSAGRAPKVAMLAAECLQRRLSPEAASRLVVKERKLVIIRAHDDEALAAVELLLGQMRNVKIVAVV